MISKWSGKLCYAGEIIIIVIILSISFYFNLLGKCYKTSA